MLFLGMANAYVMRTNMSVAIVAMVNHSAIGADHDATVEGVDVECGFTAQNAVSQPRPLATPPAFVFCLSRVRPRPVMGSSCGKPICRVTFCRPSSTAT